MQDLQEVTHDLHYENYRASRLGDEPEPAMVEPGTGRGGKVKDAEKDRILEEKEAELKKMQQMIAQMQAQLQLQQKQAAQELGRYSRAYNKISDKNFIKFFWSNRSQFGIYCHRIWNVIIST